MTRLVTAREWSFDSEAETPTTTVLQYCYTHPLGHCSCTCHQRQLTKKRPTSCLKLGSFLLWKFNSQFLSFSFVLVVSIVSIVSSQEFWNPQGGYPTKGQKRTTKERPKRRKGNHRFTSPYRTRTRTRTLPSHLVPPRSLCVACRHTELLPEGR